MSRVGLGFLTAILFAGASASAWASDDAPIATAEGRPVAPSQTSAATSAGTAAQIKQWLADSSADGSTPPIGPADRKIHGQFDAWVGNRGTRGFAAQAVIPVGSQATLAIAVSKSSGRGFYGDWGAPVGFIDPRFTQDCRSGQARPSLTIPGLVGDQACTQPEVGPSGR